MKIFYYWKFVFLMNYFVILYVLPNFCLFSFKIKAAEALSDVPDASCYNDSECVSSGRCIFAHNNNNNEEPANKSAGLPATGVCLCSRSCVKDVPMSCTKHKHCLPGNYCDREQKLCICNSSENENCAKRNLQIIYLNVSRTDSPYLGEHISIQCCTNIEPRSMKLRWFHNFTNELKSTETPDQFSKCWRLDVGAVQFKDSGLYTCSAYADGLREPVKKSVPVQVRAPITLHLNVTAINSTAIYASWTISAIHHLGVSLRVETVDRRIAFEKRNIMDESHMIIDRLKPSTWYALTVETIPFKDNRTAFDKVHVQTKEALPDKPRMTEKSAQDKISRTKCSVAWRPPVQTNGKILFYEVNMWGVLRTSPPDSQFLVSNHTPKSSSPNCADLNHVQVEHESNLCEFEGLLPNRNYSASVRAVNAAGRSLEAVLEDICLTNYAPPLDMERPVAYTNKDFGSISVYFKQKPDELNGPITCYYLAVVPHLHEIRQWPMPDALDFENYERAVEDGSNTTYAYIAESYKRLPDFTIIGDEQQQSQHERCSLYFKGRYFPMDGVLKKNHWYTGFLIARTDPDESLVKIKDSTQRIEFLTMKKKRRQLLRRAAGGASVWPEPAYSYSDFFTSVYTGNKTITPLKTDQSTSSDQCATCSKNIQSSGSQSSNHSAYLLPIVIILVLAFLIMCSSSLVYFLYRRRLLKHWLCFEFNFVPHRNSFRELQRLPRDFPPIAVENIVYEYLEKHKNSDFLLTVEFDALPHFNFDTVASDKPENNTKNRYNDIKAYDISRVMLNTMNPNSDYINANYIHVYKGKKSFIAAQGPMQDTVNDFWRMIWEKDIRIVVMVTNLQEKYRTMCAKYWPEQGSACYGDLEISPVDSTFYSDYVVRRFRMKKSDYAVPEGTDEPRNEICPLNLENDALDLPNNRRNSSEIHQVVQYHYTGWNDYRAPEGTIGLLKFLKTLRKVDAYNSTTVLVHCSAGVGRTGTFIAIDAVMDQMHDEQRADVFGVVSDMRRQRNFMVQSLEQYVFVYKALAEYYLFGETDIEAERIHEYVRDLKTTVLEDESGETNMQREFTKLTYTLDDPRSSDVAENRTNMVKNRFERFVPYDRNRIILQPVLGEADASYINASLIKGYFYPYIAAQDPLQHTIWDFWRMVIEQQVTCLVSLTDESARDSAEKYWSPDLGRSVSFGTNPAINVQLYSEDSTANCVIRRFHVTSPKINGEVREICQFAYSDWPDESSIYANFVPKSTCSLLDLIGKVLQKQSSLANPGPIVVHCSNGSTRSGLYIAVSLLLERLRAEQRIDVFQTVKTLQAQRQFVIFNLEQYEFCYLAVLDYLQSFQ